ncbi:MAG: hypothetical protein H6719_32885 [Sandaracinaceae bacterium]|nr:hypothetical protein [Sandaracinaceae bacterium]
MSRSSAAWLACALLAGCVGGRRVDLEWHTPAMCPGPMTDCPLGAVRSLQTVLERVDGTIEYSGCQEPPADLCRLDQLQDFLFVARASPSQGVEIFVTGWTEPGCVDAPPDRPQGVLAFSCETFGVGVIDLEAVERVPLWCDCPYVLPP